jgi:hypothetical protein
VGDLVSAVSGRPLSVVIARDYGAFEAAVRPYLG